MKAVLTTWAQDARYRQRKWILALMFSFTLIIGVLSGIIDPTAFNYGMGTVLAGYGFAAYFGSAVDRSGEK